MSETAWAWWRAAEEQLAANGDVDIAASVLPERQAWILSATAALEAGDRAALGDLAKTAPAVELGFVADLALSDPGAFDPTGSRAHLKLHGVRNAPLPRLDLLRLACVAHNREPPTRPPGLARAVRDRLVLDGASMVLSNRFKARKVGAPLHARSPRMASFWAAGVAQLLSDGDVRDYVQRHMPEVEPLPREPWPDLDEPIAGRQQRPSSTSLADFLRDPLGEPWGESCDQQVQVLTTRGDRSERLETLGALLDAIDALVREAAPPAAIPVVDAALTLAEASPEVQKREVLLNQLYLLDMRLCWSCSEYGPDILVPLWSGLRDLPAADRAQCARSILAETAELPLPREVRAEVLAFAAQSDADWKHDVQPWLFMHGRHVDMRAFQAALRDAPATRRERTLGYLHAVHGSAVEAYRLAARMFERGATDEANEVALTCLARSHEAPPRGRQERRLRLRAVLELARAASASASPPSSELVVALIATVHLEPDWTQRDELLAAVRSCAQQRLALPPEPLQADLLSRLQLMMVMELDSEAHLAFRDFGRWLRRARLEESLPAALRMCAELCPDAETVSRYGMKRGAPPANTSADPRPAWLHSLTTWLDHQETETVAQAALALAREHSACPSSLALWFLEVSDLDATDAWDDVVGMSHADAEDPLLAEFILNELGGELDPHDRF